MVHTSTLVLAAFAVAPVLSVPLQAPEPVRAGAPSQASAPTTKAGHATQLEARAPEPEPFSFKKLVRGAAKVARVGMGAASLLIRDEDGNVYARELDLDDLSALEAREPEPAPFSFKKFFKGAAKVAGTAARVGMGAASLLVRDVDGNIYVRELDPIDISALEAREPFRFNFKKFVSGAAKVGLGAAKLLIRDEDGTVYARDIDLDELSEVEAREPIVRIRRRPKRVQHHHDARDLTDFEDSDLLERDILDGDSDEVDTREPVNWGGVFNKVKNGASKVLRVADQVSRKAHALGLRELDEEESVVRAINDLD